MKHTKTLICFLAIIVAALGIGMFLRKTKIIEGHGGGGGGARGGARGGRYGGRGYYGSSGYGASGGYGYYPLYYGEYDDYYTSYEPYLVGQPIYPIIQQVPNYPYYY
jgi:hypothetical protein